MIGVMGVHFCGVPFDVLVKYPTAKSTAGPNYHKTILVRPLEMVAKGPIYLIPHGILNRLLSLLVELPKPSFTALTGFPPRVERPFRTFMSIR